MIKKITLIEKEESPPVTPKKPAATVKKTITSSDTANKEIKNTAPLTTIENEEKQPKKGKDKPQKAKGVHNKLALSESDYVILDKLKKKCLDAGVHVKKRNLIRAGLLRLSKLNSTALLSAIAQVEIIKAEASDD